MRDVRRVAAHEVDLCNERILNNAVVELSDGVVKECYTFSGELPFTEWLGGTIEIRRNSEGEPEAYWNGRRLE